MSEETDLSRLDATELTRLFGTKAASPVEATVATLARIERINPDYNAYCYVDHERAIAAAKESESRWFRNAPLSPIDGVTASIKDIVLTKGWPTLRGSRSSVADQTWTEDAPATARLREAGAIVVGKTTTPEFGWKGVCDSPLTGITRNPWNPVMTPGGSSGGAAVAAAHQMGVLHLGTDGGGSIRIPASFSGIFGIKPTFGTVPAFPLSRFGTIAHLGPMTSTVKDAAHMLTVLSRPDVRDWHSLPYAQTDFSAGLGAGVQGLRIAISLTMGFASADPEVGNAVMQAGQVFSELGATVIEDHPDIGDPTETFRIHWYSGAANQRRSVPVQFHDCLDPGFNMIADMGEKYTLAEYQKAADRRAEIGLRAQRFFDDYDLLLTPAVAVPPFRVGQVAPDPHEKTNWLSWTPFSYPFNLTQQPAASIPCGFTHAGLPIGLQIVGAKYRDSLVLTAARAYENVRPIRLPGLS